VSASHPWHPPVAVGQAKTSPVILTWVVHAGGLRCGRCGRAWCRVWREGVGEALRLQVRDDINMPCAMRRGAPCRQGWYGMGRQPASACHRPPTWICATALN
jgi:hypothetical protein